MENSLARKVLAPSLMEKERRASQAKAKQRPSKGQAKAKISFSLEKEY